MGGVGRSIERAVSQVNPLNQPFQFIGRATGFTQAPVNVTQPSMGMFLPSAEERAFTQELIRRSQGKGPSVAELQMQRGLDQATAQAMGLAASQRGISPGLAARAAQMQGAQMSQDLAGRAAILRAQEQLDRDQTLANLFASQRGTAAQGQQVRSTVSLGEQQLRLGAFEGAAGRGQRTLEKIGEMLKGKSVEGGGASGGAAAGGAPAPMFSGGIAGNNIVPKPQFLPTGQQYLADVSQALGVKQGGGAVPGVPLMMGDSPQNDVVPAILSPGEIVVPKSVTERGPEFSKAFVEALMKQGDQGVVR